MHVQVPAAPQSAWVGHVQLMPPPVQGTVKFAVPQTGVAHVPVSSQSWPAGHVPHDPPQASEPQTRPAQSRVTSPSHVGPHMPGRSQNCTPSRHAPTLRVDMAPVKHARRAPGVHSRPVSTGGTSTGPRSIATSVMSAPKVMSREVPSVASGRASRGTSLAASNTSVTSRGGPASIGWSSVTTSRGGGGASIATTSRGTSRTGEPVSSARLGGGSSQLHPERARATSGRSLAFTTSTARPWG